MVSKGSYKRNVTLWGITSLLYKHIDLTMGKFIYDTKRLMQNYDINGLVQERRNSIANAQESFLH